MTRSRSAAVSFIFVTVLLDIVALGVIIPILPKLIESFRGGNTALAAETVGWFGTMWATMQFFAAPIIGSLSDHFGRRPVILLSNLGLGLDYLLMGWAPSLGWLFIGRVLSGITSASIPAALAYIADVTPGQKRAKAFGVIGVAFGVGFIVGPILGGFLGQWHPRLPFWVAGALSLTNALYGLFVLPESLPQDRRTSFSWKRANPWAALSLLRRHHQLLGFSAVHFLYYLAHQSLNSVFVLYTGYRYGWDSFTVGLSLGLVGVSFSIVQGALVGPMVARWGERRTLLMGLAFGAAGFAIYGVAPTGWWFAAGIPIMSLWGFYGPAAQGLISQRVGSSEQGQLQGALASVVTLTGIAGPKIFTRTFSTFITRAKDWHLPGAPYLLASALLLVAVAIAWRLTRKVVPAAETVGAA